MPEETCPQSQEIPQREAPPQETTKPDSGPESRPAMPPPPRPGLTAPPTPPQTQAPLLAPIQIPPPYPFPAPRQPIGMWTSEPKPARPMAFVAVLVISLVAAGTVPEDRPGLGWGIAGLVATAGFVMITLDAGVHREAGGKAHALERLGWALASVALVGVGAIRAAEWLFVLCALAAGLAIAIAVGRARSALGLLFAVLAVPAAVFRGAAWFMRGARQITFLRREPKLLARTAGSVLVGLALVTVFGSLLAWADPAFARVVSALVPDAELDAVLVRWSFRLGFALACAVAGALLLVNPTRYAELRIGRPTPVRRIEWMVPIGALVALFALFLGVQLTVLFSDERYVIRTAGLTFAEYARTGFGQLVVVTLLTLVVIVLTLRLAPKVTGSDRTLLRSLLGALVGCTMLIVASALWRMWVYEQAYGWTRLRLVVSAFEVWLGVVFVLIALAGVRLRTGWLPRASIAAGMVVLLALAALNPDRFVAGQNVDRYQRTGRIDVGYLQTLSADAVPELDRLPAKLRECALRSIAEQLRNHPDGWTEYNFGRSAARSADLPRDEFYLTPCPR